VFAAAPSFGSASESDSARGLSPPPGKSLVYIYQRDRDGSGITPKIFLNNYEIGRLVPGAFTVWQLAPGQLNFRIDGAQPARLSIVSQAGKVYLIRVSVVQTAAGPVAQLTSLPASYRSDMIGTLLIKNPRAVTVDAAGAAPRTASPATRDTQATTQAQAKPPAESKPKSRSAVSYSDIKPGGMSLLLKTGALSLSTDRQTILGMDFQFDDSASGVYDAELFYQFDSGLTVGGELLGYTADFVEVGTTDRYTADVLIIMGTVRQYFRTRSTLQPFIGAGLGAAGTDVSGPGLSGSTSGLAYEAIAGIEYRWEGVGLTAEYKFLSADTEDANGEKVDVSGSGFFAGLAIHF